MRWLWLAVAVAACGGGGVTIGESCSLVGSALAQRRAACGLISSSETAANAANFAAACCSTTKCQAADPNASRSSRCATDIATTDCAALATALPSSCS